MSKREKLCAKTSIKPQQFNSKITASISELKITKGVKFINRSRAAIRNNTIK